MATTDLRVPVVIYNKLTRAEECALFIDINTKQRPVPNELLLDIKRMAETEKDEEALLRDVFDKFATEPNSPLLGLLSPSERQRGKISRVTFNAALKAIAESLTGGTVETIYGALSSYLHACVAGLRKREAGDNITNSTLFRALLLMFPTLAERVADRHGSQFTPEYFAEVLEPFFSRVRSSDLRQPGRLTELQDNFRKALRTGFSIGTVAIE